MSSDREDPFERWFAELEQRHLARLTFPEIRRALSSLSSLYVERRGRLASGAALEGAGKRAAFALFYGTIHFLTVRNVVRSLGLASRTSERILDLGCGTGVAGAAWALECTRPPALFGVDRNGWAVSEARWNYSSLHLTGQTRCADLARARFRGGGETVLAAYVLNELKSSDRESLLPRLLGAGRRGSTILVVEPIARRGFPWWEEWSAGFLALGGRNDEWCFSEQLPGKLLLLDRAAGMDHRELRARSLCLEGTP